MIEEEVLPVIRKFLPHFTLDIGPEAEARLRQSYEQSEAEDTKLLEEQKSRKAFSNTEKSHAEIELDRRKKHEKLQQEKGDLWPGEEDKFLGRGRGKDIY